MKITGDGFLSKNGREEAKKIFDHNIGVFQSLELSIASFREFASSLEVLKQDTVKEQQKIIVLVLALRLLEISEASLLIMRNGMSNEANTMFRVFLDAYFIFANMCSDESFIANYFKSDEATRLKLLNSAKKHNSELFTKINNYATETLKDELKNKIS